MMLTAVDDASSLEERVYAELGFPDPGCLLEVLNRGPTVSAPDPGEVSDEYPPWLTRGP